MDTVAADTRVTGSSSKRSGSPRHSKNRTSRTSDLFMAILTLGAWLFVRPFIAVWHALGINKSKAATRLH